MPFMRGPGPVRRTLQHLEAGRLQLHDAIRIFTVNYNAYGDRHKGIKEFVFWELPRLQYLNPKTQVATFLNMTPTPFIRCYLDDGRDMLIDVDNKSSEEILNHLVSAVGKSQLTLAAESLARQQADNPANFGVGCDRACMCEISGQLPCPGVVQLPRKFRGKYKYYLKDEIDN